MQPQLSPSTPPPALSPEGRQLESVRAEAAEKGDVGLVAENSRSTQRLMLPPPPLTASGVFSKFRDIARLTGSAVSGGLLTPDPRHFGDLRPCVHQEGFWVDHQLGHFSSACGGHGFLSSFLHPSLGGSLQSLADPIPWLPHDRTLNTSWIKGEGGKES